MIFSGNATVMALKETAARDPNIKAIVWNKLLEAGAMTHDDFSQLEGETGSNKPFWRKNDLSADGGDTVIFTTIGDASGPGVRGEQELTGNTSDAVLATFQCRVDFWRDAIELTKKQRKMIAVNRSLESVLLGMLAKKLGRQKMYDMMMCLNRKTKGNVLRPNNKQSRDELRDTDTINPSFLVEAKALAQGRGAKPIGLTKSKSGSTVNQFLAFICQDALTDIRNSTSYQNALLNAGARGSESNEIFTGKVVDWQGIFIWEHIVVDGDTQDFIGSPMNAKAKLGEAIAAGTTAPVVKGHATNTKNRYFQFFPGYDWIWVEGQTPTADANTYYFWIVNPPDASVDPGKAGFYSYVGSTGNADGNKITTASRLAAAAAGDAVTKLGEVNWDSATMTTQHPAGAIIIPANKWGVPIAHSYLLGAGSALRAYGSIKSNQIFQDRDFGFVKGMGYESIFGQTVTVDTEGYPRNYMLLEHAVEHPGIRVPFVPVSP